MNRDLRFLVISLLVTYSTLLLLGTLFPFDFRLNARTVSYFPSPEWIPFTYHDPRCPWTGFFRDKLFNIVMFLPFGVLLGMIIQSGAKPERILLKTAVLAAFFSLIIESFTILSARCGIQRPPISLRTRFGAFSEPGSCPAALRSSHSNSAGHHEQGLRHYRGDFGDRTSCRT